ncbi:TPA: cytidyltransferase [Candidatus Nomurabacteria bacterium]|nr:MAG: Glycerol-3-phosphate cytidylyltransferase [Parcubacteria bacterium RAAC4_OD1_1]HCY26117.1 cytidyltransferase [Candidatus Nomurabacteria bacterium]
MVKKIKKKKEIRAKNKKEIIVMISGGFDPIHIGHIRYIKEAKKLGDYLVVVINNDNWLRVKKGKEFMGELERKEIIEAIAGVDEVIISKHCKNTKDMSVCEEIKLIKPDIFANGGDRKPSWDPVPEVSICKELGIKMVYNVGRGGKVKSSSEMLKNYAKTLKKNK